jgi:hypothetical protein
MRQTILFVLAWQAFSQIVVGQVVTLHVGPNFGGNQQEVEIKTNQFVQFVSAGGYDATSGRIGRLTISHSKDGAAVVAVYDVRQDVTGAGLYRTDSTTRLDYPVFAGPLHIKLAAVTGAGVPAFCTIKIAPQTESISVPNSAVVIPSDAAGPVEIILESSEDLVTWTAANPGIYGASTAKRFFRVRAVARPN